MVTKLTAAILLNCKPLSPSFPGHLR